MSGVRERAAPRPVPAGNKPAADTADTGGNGAIGTVRWTVKVDRGTDARLRMHIAHKPGTDFDTLVERAVNRELDRLALIEAERSRTLQPSDDMWSITIPLQR